MCQEDEFDMSYPRPIRVRITTPWDANKGKPEDKCVSCRQCGGKFETYEKVISKQRTNYTAYWHYDCAKRMNII